MALSTESFEMLVRQSAHDGHPAALTHRESLDELAGIAHYFVRLAGKRADFSYEWAASPENGTVNDQPVYRTTIGKIVDVSLPSMPVLSLLTQPPREGQGERVVGLIGHDMDRVEHTIRLNHDEQFVRYEVDGRHSRRQVTNTESMAASSRYVPETQGEMRTKVYGIGQAVFTQLNYLQWLLEDAAEANEQLS